MQINEIAGRAFSEADGHVRSAAEVKHALAYTRVDPKIEGERNKLLRGLAQIRLAKRELDQAQLALERALDQISPEVSL